MLVPIMWIQNAAHSVLWICINIVFFHVPVISNVKGVVAFSRVMYLDAHVKPPPLFDVNETTLSVEPENNIIYLPMIYINHFNVTSFSVCRGSWSTRREGEKNIYKYIYVYKVIWHCAVHKSDISIFFFPSAFMPGSDVIKDPGADLNSGPQKKEKKKKKKQVLKVLSLYSVAQWGIEPGRAAFLFTGLTPIAVPDQYVRGRLQREVSLLSLHATLLGSLNKNSQSDLFTYTERNRN